MTKVCEKITTTACTIRIYITDKFNALILERFSYLVQPLKYASQPQQMKHFHLVLSTSSEAVLTRLYIIVNCIALATSMAEQLQL